MPVLILGLAGCSALQRAVTPVRTPPRPPEEVIAALEAAGPRIRPGLLAAGAVVQTPDTVLTGADARRFWAEGVAGVPRYEQARYETGDVYVCPSGAVQVGAFVAEQRLPGASTPLPVHGRWLARWTLTDAGWRIVEAALRPSPLKMTSLAIEPECLAPSEMSMQRHRTGFSVHWGGLWAHGGPLPGIETQFRYAGFDSFAPSSSAWAVGIGRRLFGSWGGRLLVARRTAVGTAMRADRSMKLRGSATVAGLLLSHERWLLRFGAGPAAASVEWTWSDPAGPSSSGWMLGWVNELAVAIPLRNSFFLDLSYHDWLFGTKDPPPFAGIHILDTRLRASSISLGLGTRF